MSKTCSEPRAPALVEHRPYVIKSKEAIHVANEMTLLQRQSWNHLLHYAYDDLLEKDEHAISLKELMDRLGIRTRNLNHLKEALEGLGRNILKWDVLNADGENDWGFYALLSRVRIYRGVVTYAFDTDLRRKLHNPAIYARISLAIQNRFRSKHALALYEICVHWRRREGGRGETPWIPVAKFRELMGLAEGVYPEFKKLNKWVIKEPLKEINELTDLRVEADYKRQGRRVFAVKFRIWTRAEVIRRRKEQKTLFPEEEPIPEIVVDLIKAGLPEREAFDIWKKGWSYVHADKRKHREDFITYVREKIALLDSKPEGKVKNRVGFLIEAIREDYTDPYLEGETRVQRQLNVADALRQLNEREDRVQKEWDRAAHRECEKILRKDPALLEEVLDILFQEEPFTRTFLKRGQSPSGTYASGGALTSMVDSFLRRRFSERFLEVDRRYGEQINQIKEEIATLSTS